MILENFRESLQIMEAKFQWRISQELRVYNSDQKTSENFATAVVENDELRRLVTLDVELYEFAKYLSRKQIEEVRYRKDYRRSEN